MIPPKKKPNAKALFRGLPAVDDGAGRVGPTMAAWKSSLPDIEGEWPKHWSERQMSNDELLNMAMDASTPMGMVAGATRKVAAKVVEPLIDRLPKLWHGTAAEAFPKFLREKAGRGAGGNRMGISPGYLTDLRKESTKYMEEGAELAGKGRSHIITKRGSKLYIPADEATRLRNQESSLEELIGDAEKNLADFQETAPRKFNNQSIVDSKIKERQSKLFDLLTARDEEIKEVVRPGTLMEVGLDVDPSKLLNYDKDLIDQTPFVQDAIKGVLGIRGDISPRNPSQIIAFNRMLRGLPEDAISKRVEESGILGVKGYTPRGITDDAGKKAMNYAIFDPDRMSILRTLGLLGLLTGGMAGRDSTTTPQQRLQ